MTIKPTLLILSPNSMTALPHWEETIEESWLVPTNKLDKLRPHDGIWLMVTDHLLDEEEKVILGDHGFSALHLERIDVLITAQSEERARRESK